MRALFLIFASLFIIPQAFGDDELKQYAELQALYVETTMEAISLSLTETSDFLGRNPEADEMLQHNTLAKYVDRTPGLRAIIYVNEKGDLKADSFTYPARKIKLKDREYVKQSMNSTEQKLYISKPVVGRSSGVPFVPISQPILDRNNKAYGVIAGILTPEILIKQDMLCNQCFSGVFRNDNTPLITYPSTASYKVESLNAFLDSKKNGFHEAQTNGQTLHSWVIHSEKFPLSIIVSTFMTEQ
ncbi:hypothetical protein RYZ26_12680 [Terasakiella sp. A23]|uniref:PDC sensor domain-containing protein n=1 Tax=Terasakiella sp. FCG-A23 TaxID=3080561 RepID=UPI002953CF5A|nr:hypothetical protein [Terasakiella sp. A23]MDV7340453.1 hypothetical protein [Terasakiella sp. A23]